MSRDPGPDDTREVSVSSFERVLASGAFRIAIRSGEQQSLVLTGPRTMLDDTELRVSDGRLLIGWQEGARWSWNNGQGVDILITTPALGGAMIGEAGMMSIERLSGPKVELMLAGAGAMTVGEISATELKAVVSGSGSLCVENVESDETVATLGGSGTLRLAGSSGQAKIVSAGSGMLDVRGLIVRDATIASAGSGDVRATVNDRAEVQIAGSGDVELGGGAKCKVSKAGSGNVRCN